jgi:NAD-dependent SIR2 family protein deacetylase
MKTTIYLGLSMPTSWCHGCGRATSWPRADNITPNADHRRPEPGDVTICDQCGAVSVLNDILVLEKPPDDAFLDRLSEEDRQVIADRVAQIKGEK